MKLQMSFSLILLVVFLAFATESRADSDAYSSLSLWNSQGGYAWRCGSRVERGIYIAGEVTLLDFLIYHLICSEDRIEISGWRNVFTKYLIEIAKSGELRNPGPTEFPERQWSDAAKDGPAPDSLGYFGAARRTTTT
jgi:hypothetical protein